MQTIQMEINHQIRDDTQCEADEMVMSHRHGMVSSLPAKLIESLDDSHENIKVEEIPREQLPEIDEFNEFSEPEDMMEDLRKEVEKVVETIDDNECLPDTNWNYPVPDEIEETDEQSELIYSENLIQSNANSSMGSHYDDIENTNGEPDNEDVDNSEMLHHTEDTRNFESDDDEDDKPLEQVRQSLQKSSKAEIESKKFHVEDDKEDRELTECLKKIHNFKCTSCNKAFNSRTALGYHLKTHNTERRFVCDQVSFNWIEVCMVCITLGFFCSVGRSS